MSTILLIFISGIVGFFIGAATVIICVNIMDSKHEEIDDAVILLSRTNKQLEQMSKENQVTIRHIEESVNNMKEISFKIRDNVRAIKPVS
jgi:hypothetical protein